MELASPITVYWDIPAESCPAELLQRICTDISECRPLMLQLYCDAPCILPEDGLSLVLRHFKGSPISVFLTMSGSALASAPPEYLKNFKLKELLVSADRLDDLDISIKDVKQQSGILPGVSFKVTDANWRELPVLVKLCRTAGVKRLVLPMQRLGNQESPFLLSSGEQQELASNLASAGGSEELSLTIHDPFLWRAFNPDVPFPQAGCQAANTMLAIAADGAVYPCPTLPVNLGSITERNLMEIIFSAEKKAFRLKLQTPPANCGGCAELAICRGGCRGRGLALEGTLDSIDPACR